MLDRIFSSSETAVAGRDVAYTMGNTAVSATVTFYMSAEAARESGEALLQSAGYQTCIQELLASSIRETNGDVADLSVVSADLAAPTVGEQSVAIQHLASFSIPVLGDRVLYTDEWLVNVGRANLLMTWVSDVESDPFELELLLELARRLENEMAAYE